MDEYTVAELAYKNGYEDAFKDIAKIICEACGNGGCPFKEGCEAYSDQACLERIIECFKLKINKTK